MINDVCPFCKIKLDGRASGECCNKCLYEGSDREFQGEYN